MNGDEKEGPRLIGRRDPNRPAGSGIGAGPLKELTLVPASPAREIATLGGGCFWCLEAVYRNVKGVEKVDSGYAGGHVENPSYEQVCTGTTGHAEVVQLTFDPEVIGYRELLEVFFSIHDPTTPDRQGADVGPQYRSVIFYHTPEQRAIADEVIGQLERESLWDAPIVTQVVPFEAFYPAEEYHHRYFERNPHQGYCQVVIAPKVAKFRRAHAHLLTGHDAPPSPQPEGAPR